MAYEPSMASNHCASNVFEEKTFKVRVTFGSSSVTSYLAKDITFARTGTGTYTATFPKPYTAVTDFSFGMKDATGATLNFVISSDAIATTGILTLEARVAAGTATDPASGDVAYLTFGVSSSNLNEKFGG